MQKDPEGNCLPGLRYMPQFWFILSSIFQAISSTLFAAFAAAFRTGFCRGIIMTATAPAAAPSPAVMAQPFTDIAITPFGSSMPEKKCNWASFVLFTQVKLYYNDKKYREWITMSVDTLQEKIRKLKNPTMLELCPVAGDIPAVYLEAESTAVAYSRYCRDLLAGLKELIPAVRVSFGAFALLGAEGMDALAEVLAFARKNGYYVALEAPELLSVKLAAATAEALLGKDSKFPCDGLIISGYPGSDVIKPFLSYCKEGKKDLFVVARTSNKSAPELQDLLTGGRLVHAAAADHVNRYGAETAGKFGYTRVGILAAASAAQSLKDLRAKYPKLFMILDGADYPNANAKNCANAFDKFGHGAIAVVGNGITCAWQQEEGGDPLACAVAAADRMKKNFNRYLTIL